jgi:uridylate kinase
MAKHSADRKYQRILLKLSGEALTGNESFGIDPKVLDQMALEIGQLVGIGVQVGLVVGGGNLFRGSALSTAGLDRVTGDHMGMLATVMNSLALQDALEGIGIDARVMSAISVHDVCEDYIRRRAIRHLEKGRVVICAGGTGNPFFTTDTAAALRAIEIGADIVLKATKVAGVYSADPTLDAQAELFDKLSYDRVIESKLDVMDANAVVLCRDQEMPIRVFSVFEEGNLGRLIKGEAIGTLVS